MLLFCWGGGTLAPESVFPLPSKVDRAWHSSITWNGFQDKLEFQNPIQPSPEFL
jgi:hypothetical protein